MKNVTVISLGCLIDDDRMGVSTVQYRGFLMTMRTSKVQWYDNLAGPSTAGLGPT